MSAILSAKNFIQASAVCLNLSEEDQLRAHDDLASSQISDDRDHHHMPKIHLLAIGQGGAWADSGIERRQGSEPCHNFGGVHQVGLVT
jgi:hypothetical protein